MKSAGFPVDAWSTFPFVMGYAIPGSSQAAEISYPIPQLTIRLGRIGLTPLIQLSLRVEYPSLIGLVIRVHGSLLRLQKRIARLSPFAMWPAFPTSDYYGDSAPTGPLPRSPRIALVRQGRRPVGSHVPVPNLCVLR